MIAATFPALSAGQSVWLRTALFALMVVSSAASSADASQLWTTTLEVVVGGEPGSADALTRVTDVVPDVDGTTLWVRQSERVSIWRVADTSAPILEYGRRNDTAPLGAPLGAFPDASGFWIRYSGGWGRFWARRRPCPCPSRTRPTAGRGQPLPKTAPCSRAKSLPPSPERSSGRPTTRAGRLPWRGFGPPRGAGFADTLALYDSSGQDFAVAYGTSRLFEGQPFSDHDLTYLNLRRGAAGVVQRRGRADEVRVVEIMPGPDTILDVRLPLRPTPMQRERVEAAIEPKARSVRDLMQRADGSPPSDAAVRAIVEEALYVPSRLPLVTAAISTVLGRSVAQHERGARPRHGLACAGPVGRRRPGAAGPAPGLVPASRRHARPCVGTRARRALFGTGAGAEAGPALMPRSIAFPTAAGLLLLACADGGEPSGSPYSEPHPGAVGPTVALVDSLLLEETEYYIGRPYSLSADTADGSFLIADGYSNRIFRFGRDGRFLQSYGHPGEGPGEFTGLSRAFILDRFDRSWHRCPAGPADHVCA